MVQDGLVPVPDRGGEGPTSEEGLGELGGVDQKEINLVPMAVEFIRRVMPSQKEYDARAALFPETYGNAEWVAHRVAECLEALSQPMSGRSNRVYVLFTILGIRDIGDDNRSTINVLKPVLDTFTTPSDLHRAVSAYAAVVTNLMNGFTKMEDWDGMMTELIEIPQQRYPELEISNDTQISLLYRGNDEWLAHCPEEFLHADGDSSVVDIESLRVDVLKNSANSMGSSSLYKAGADPMGELRSLFITCAILRSIRDFDPDDESIPLLGPVMDEE